MIWLNPSTVTLGPHQLTNVVSIAVDRAARRLVEEWTDLGPHLGFADVPEQRVRISIARRITESEATGPKPGEQLALSFRASAGLDAAAVRLVTMTVVITDVEHALSARGLATQRVRAVALSTTGAADPVNESIVEGEL